MGDVLVDRVPGCLASSNRYIGPMASDESQGWAPEKGNRLPAPDPWLRSMAPAFGAALPGPVLDLACGRGRNALWLAARGHIVVGADASPEALEAARETAARENLTARFEAVEVDSANPGPLGRENAWGAILVFHFLDRALFPRFAAALAPGGLLAYKTHLGHPLRAPGSRPRRAAYLLRPGELLGAFQDLHRLAYAEWAADGKAFAALLARREGHSR